jgi:hypothetical protein
VGRNRFPTFWTFSAQTHEIRAEKSENCLRFCRNLLFDFHRFMTETAIKTWPNTGRGGAAVVLAVVRSVASCCISIEIQVKLLQHNVKRICLGQKGYGLNSFGSSLCLILV